MPATLLRLAFRAQIQYSFRSTSSTASRSPGPVRLCGQQTPAVFILHHGCILSSQLQILPSAPFICLFSISSISPTGRVQSQSPQRFRVASSLVSLLPYFIFCHILDWNRWSRWRSPGLSTERSSVCFSISRVPQSTGVHIRVSGVHGFIHPETDCFQFAEPSGHQS